MRIQSRAELNRAQTIVIKIGSALLAETSTPTVFERVSQEVAALLAGGYRVVIVSSGAIALGLEQLGYARRPTQLPDLQACAAAGQGRLQRRWDEAFATHSVAVAQVLLTHADLQNRSRFLNAQSALRVLLERGAVPIVNENDTVSVDEIKLGDNDTLAAQVCDLVGGEVVVLLTNADGLRTADPNVDPASVRIATVEDVSEVEGMAKGASGVGTGGMRTKLEAAKIAQAGGAATVIAPGHIDKIIASIFAGDDVGTFVSAGDAPTLSAKKRWLSSTIRPQGTIVVDPGAKKALLFRGASLLGAGVAEIVGEFSAQDPVEIRTTTGGVFAHGLAATSSTVMREQAGKSSDELKHARSSLVIHRDDLAVTDDG